VKAIRVATEVEHKDESLTNSEENSNDRKNQTLTAVDVVTSVPHSSGRSYFGYPISYFPWIIEKTLQMYLMPSDATEIKTFKKRLDNIIKHSTIRHSAID
jgi:hypothetical protein